VERLVTEIDNDALRVGAALHEKARRAGSKAGQLGARPTFLTPELINVGDYDLTMNGFQCEAIEKV
jgi:hypothetical protein